MRLLKKLQTCLAGRQVRGCSPEGDAGVLGSGKSRRPRGENEADGLLQQSQG